ncbi:unnamed protein product [Rotaria sordida]|uniref:Peptidase M11 gametolysin domain-containing protein n=1 Tax=Rotaria sordida TaxID=392033 RepID=A0A815NNY9_9BILA|nr:unnamed protein product [Rotaria sordida]CAF1440587.1 unnamed protein product [Rotaria sordida]CAF4019742.1 unnamed protein product [Rotaria sordida]CAF4110640.1 unnamed protein product [Rotaria sordida]
MMNIFILLLVVCYHIHDVDGAMYPLRGEMVWRLILCKFSDSPTPKYTPAQIKEKFLTRGNKGIADYWNDMSSGLINFGSSSVHGWYTLSQTTAQQKAKSRDAQFDDCVKASALPNPSKERIIVVTSPDIDIWGQVAKVYVSENDNIARIVHEMAHGYGLGHSYSDDPDYKNNPIALIGEYDDEWDLMSVSHAKMTENVKYGKAPPSFSGYYLERVGWIPMDRVYTFGQKGEKSATLTLTTLWNPAPGLPSLIRVPFDPADPRHYYLIEMRFKENWDAAFDQNTVFISEIKLNPNKDNTVKKIYYPYLLRMHNTPGENPITSLNKNNVKITPGAINVQKRTVSVSIESNFADLCFQGYVWRQATPDDRVCVTPAIRAQILIDNGAAASRRNPSGGPNGVDTCKAGFVWRQASPKDHVCVLPATRDQAQSDNKQAADRQNPSQLVNGPLGCLTGSVWRRNDKNDYVCVPSATKKQRILTDPTAILRAIKRLQANNYLLLLKKLYAAESEQYNENLLR